MRSKLMRFLLSAATLAVAATGGIPSAHAIPAFAIREKVACTTCHTNGSAPHLTKSGYLYRRAGFRFPTEIGDTERDKKAMTMAEHLSAGINVSYELVQQKNSTANPGNTYQLTSNQINVPTLLVFPIVGGFLGNFGAWSEIDFTPLTTGTRGTPTTVTDSPTGDTFYLPGGTAAQNGGVSVQGADLRYVRGDKEMWFGLRAGLVSAEGFGGADQWIDDGSLPLFDTLAANYNQSILAIPLGAFNAPQMGFELEFNYENTFATLGVYNGFDGANGLANATASTSTVQLMNVDRKGLKDIKGQVDQFLLGDAAEVTATAYFGHISLLDPNNSVIGATQGVGTWVNDYQMYRLYPTYRVIPNQLDVMGGLAYGHTHYINPGNLPARKAKWSPDGTFDNKGAFLGANGYLAPHLTVSARYDYFTFDGARSPKGQGFALLASLPFDNNLFVFHYNNTWIDSVGNSRDFRAEWRFLF